MIEPQVVTAQVLLESLAKRCGPKTPAVPTKVGTAEEEKEERRKEFGKTQEYIEVSMAGSTRIKSQPRSGRTLSF